VLRTSAGSSRTAGELVGVLEQLEEAFVMRFVVVSKPLEQRAASLR
jgi:hypothetical protein